MCAQLGQAFGIETEVVPRAAPFFFHQTGRFQCLQVLRYSRTRHRKLSCEFAYGGWLLPEQVDDRLPRGMGEGGQQFRSVSHILP